MEFQWNFSAVSEKTSMSRPLSCRKTDSFVQIILIISKIFVDLSHVVKLTQTEQSCQLLVSSAWIRDDGRWKITPFHQGNLRPEVKKMEHYTVPPRFSPFYQRSKGSKALRGRKKNSLISAAWSESVSGSEEELSRSSGMKREHSDTSKMIRVSLAFLRGVKPSYLFNEKNPFWRTVELDDLAQNAFENCFFLCWSLCNI